MQSAAKPDSHAEISQGNLCALMEFVLMAQRAQLQQGAAWLPTEDRFHPWRALVVIGEGGVTLVLWHGCPAAAAIVLPGRG